MATTATAISITPTNIGGELVADDESDSLNVNLDGFDPLWVSPRHSSISILSHNDRPHRWHLHPLQSKLSIAFIGDLYLGAIPQPNAADPSGRITGPGLYGLSSGILRLYAGRTLSSTGFAESTMPVERVGGGN